jgi:malate dehydrogenase (oxaloacetate-decarboxylating)(NADP+)
VSTQEDLALAYSPGVAAPCVEIQRDPPRPTNTPPRATWSASSPTAARGARLGNIGALAGKPVMEGKVVLFKKFAGIDAFDIEIDESDPG